MKTKAVLFTLFLLSMTSCQRTSTETWEDVKTAGRYFQRSLYALWGSDEESRQIASEKDFTGPEENEFIPLQETDLFVAKAPVSSPKITQASPVHNFPSSTNFLSPTQKLSHIFRTIHFDTDNHVIQDKEDLITVARIAEFLKKNPQAKILIEGHTDKRASADYNMALGMRRAHHVEVLLKKQGVSSQQIKTVSFGKEKPLSSGSAPVDHKVNRRAQFKIQSH